MATLNPDNITAVIIMFHTQNSYKPSLYSLLQLPKRKIIFSFNYPARHNKLTIQDYMLQSRKTKNYFWDSPYFIPFHSYSNSLTLIQIICYHRIKSIKIQFYINKIQNPRARKKNYMFFYPITGNIGSRNPEFQVCSRH